MNCKQVPGNFSFFTLEYSFYIGFVTACEEVVIFSCTFLGVELIYDMVIHLLAL